MKPLNIRHTPHRVTHMKMIARRKACATASKSKIQNRFTKPWGRKTAPALETPAGKKFNGGDSRKAYATAAGFSGLALLGTACSTADILGEHTNNQTYVMAEEKSYEKMVDSVDPLPALTIISAVAFAWFTFDGIRTKRKVPGIIGPSGLVPTKFRKDEGTNPFPEFVTAAEFARIRKEVGLWGKKNRKEKYSLQIDVNTFELSLVPNDFKYTFNKNMLPALLSLGAAMLFFALWASSVVDEKETNTAPTQQIETRASE